MDRTSKVNQLHLASCCARRPIKEQNILGLDVPVNYVTLMQILESMGNLVNYSSNLFLGEPFLFDLPPIDFFEQIATFAVIKDLVNALLVLHDFMQFYDIRMLKLLH